MVSTGFDTSGKIVPPSADDLARADEATSILAYIHGTMADGRPYYAYVAVKPSKYREFHAITAARKAMVIGEYGTVVAAGFQSDPPFEVIKEMHELYGFDDRYEEKLTQEAIKEREIFFEKNEKERIAEIVSMLQKGTLAGK